MKGEDTTKYVSAPVRKGDLVMVTCGKERGKTGKIIDVISKRQCVLIEKMNFVKRHAKPSQRYKQGGIIEKESPIHWSNIALMCQKCGKSSRQRIKVDKEGRKARVCVRCGEQFGRES